MTGVSIPDGKGKGSPNDNGKRRYVSIPDGEGKMIAGTNQYAGFQTYQSSMGKVYQSPMGKM